MRLLFFIASLIAILPCQGTSPELVNGIRQEYKSKMELWTLTMQAATTAEAQAKIWSERPDGVTYAQRMWNSLKPVLGQDWSIEPASWLLKLTCSLPSENITKETVELRAEIITTITNAIETRHLRSAKLAPVCMGLLAVGDSPSLKLLERIEKENPDRKVQGVAALAVAILLQNLSDDTNNMKRRLNLIRKSIIESADVEIDGVSIATLAADQLYLIRYLTKGRVAPELQGTDAAGAPIKLSDFTGKVVVLLFWNTAINDYERVLEIHRKLVTKMAGKPFVLLGVTNDSMPTLRAMQADGSVTWRNFSDTKNELAKQYRVQGMPFVYVLDRERKIQYVGNPGSFVELTADALMAP